MHNIELSEDLKKELQPILSKGIKAIFSDLFSVEISEYKITNTQIEKDLISIGRLHQEDMDLYVRFIFQKELLRPVLSQIYSPEFLENDAVFKDTAGEIVNILCGQIKCFLNNNGYNLAFDIPEVHSIDEAEKYDRSFLNLCFSLNEDSHFLLNLNQD